MTPSISLLIDTAEAARILGVSTATVSSWRRKGVGPPVRTFGPRLHRYDTAELAEWIEHNRRVSPRVA